MKKSKCTNCGRSEKRTILGICTDCINIPNKQVHAGRTIAIAIMIGVVILIILI